MRNTRYVCCQHGRYFFSPCLKIINSHCALIMERVLIRMAIGFAYWTVSHKRMMMYFFPNLQLSPCSGVILWLRLLMAFWIMKRLWDVMSVVRFLAIFIDIHLISIYIFINKRIKWSISYRDSLRNVSIDDLGKC